MNYIDELIEQVLSEFTEFKSYLDEDTLYREVVFSIKEMGNNVVETYETTIDIQKGVGDLPSSFYRLDRALVCDIVPPDSDIIPLEVRTLTKSDYVVERDFHKTEWISCNPCCKKESYSYKEDKIFFVKRYNEKPKCFSKFRELKLTPHSHKYCLSECINKHITQCDDSASIDYRRGQIKVNFEEGTIYIKYKGFPQDEDGNIDFTDTANGSMERFLEFSLKVKILDMLKTVPSAGGLMQFYPIYSADKEKYRHRAKKELVLGRFDRKRFTENLVKQNRKDYYRKAGL